jgi:uncharacterized membrane protein
MSTASAIIFSVALVFYILAWKYIVQMMHEVNANAIGKRVSLWRWEKGWKIHKQSFPASPVRLRVATCIALTACLGLIAFCIEVHNKMAHR